MYIRRYSFISIGIIAFVGCIFSLVFAYTDKQRLSSDTFDRLIDNQLTKYTQINDFRPNDPIARGEASKFITQYAKLLHATQIQQSCTFTDIAQYDASLTDFIIQSCKFGLFQGNKGKFMPYDHITQAQALAVIVRSIDGYLDEQQVPRYQAYVDVGKELGLLDDVAITTLDTTPITRAQLATWLHTVYTITQAPEFIQESIVYETDVDGADDCSSYEKYDSIKKVCYYECSNELHCMDIQAQIDEELADWTEDRENDGSMFVDTTNTQEEDENIDILASYNIINGELIMLQTGIDQQAYRNLRKEIADLSPNTLSNNYLEAFKVYSNADSDTLAYVADDDANGKRDIVINLATHQTSTIKEQKMTLIHELSHILTLNTSQIQSNFSSCSTYQAEEGCSTKQSYLNTFVQKFWRDDKTPSYDPAIFVTEYATTSPEEDIAESFAAFVLEAKSNNNSIKAQKINFFYQYPDVVAIRDAMRSSLGQSIMRAKKTQ